MILNSFGRRAASLALVCLAALAAPLAQAENFAMVMTIGAYSNPNASLPGIDLDAQSARKIAQSMGVSSQNILDYKDSQLSVAGIRAAFAALTSRIAAGDNVFIYYSGHGTQKGGSDGAKCSEGIVGHDMAAFNDTEIETTLAKLTAKAGQVVMLNDSCFSGGQATRSLGDGGMKAKTWKSSAIDAPGSTYQCGSAINAKMTRNLVPTAAKQGANFLYIAAANDKEVAFASAQGSSATVAWASCLGARADTDNSGMLTGRELQQCAQDWIRNHNYNQTVTLVGNAGMPLSFTSQAPAAAGATTPAGTVVAMQAPLAALENLRQQASPAIRVDLVTARPSLRIGRDYLDLSVHTSQDGYLYLLHVGSDGKSFDLLFPNSRDTDNFVKAGRTTLPRASWGIQSSGPAGTSHVLAVLSDKPRDFDRGMAQLGNSPFRFAAASAGAVRNLAVVGMGQGVSAPGRIGASSIVGIVEVE